MSKLNEQQEKIAEHLDGFLVVDAGPGTGKTHTLVERYVHLLEKKIDPQDILMLTFTKNAAQEMKERISGQILSTVFANKAKDVRTSTFDAFCLKVVLNSPDAVTEFFGIEDTLSRNARLVDNYTLNKDYFRNFYAQFIVDHGNRYVKPGINIAALASDSIDDIYGIISKLMSRGVIPLKDDEWFDNGEKIINGRVEKVLNDLIKLEEKGSISKEIKSLYDSADDYNLPLDIDPRTITKLPDDLLNTIAKEDRRYLFYFIHDVYYDYVVRSIVDNRLTFGLVSLFAFSILYSDPRARSQHSVDYLMVDEFQDTNELQLMICLLLLKKPNFCVVGDWKQGIYEFRFVSKENITDFDNRVDTFISKLNKKGAGRIPFEMPKVIHLNLTQNYRSSSLVLEKAFGALEIKGNRAEDVPAIIDDPNIVMLESTVNEKIGNNTAFEMIKGEDRESEVIKVIKKILDYKKSERYKIMDDDGSFRDVKYGDIAVLCRNGSLCRDILKMAEVENIPAFFQGDLDVMATREGKLALAWLRFINNVSDRRGPIAILADMKVPLSQMLSMFSHSKKNIIEGDVPETFNQLPRTLLDQRTRLLKKRRRPNDLLTSIFAFYNLDNDITQSIINILSSAYSSSLLTISDLIRLIEEDIKNSTKYDIDPALDREAVTIQTMHKSKGLEYPIVIIAGLDDRVMPNNKSDNSIFKFDHINGIRCTKEFFERETDGVIHERVLKSWKYEILKMIESRDYSEERRLFFVALSRAKQYLTVSCYNPSNFIKYYGVTNFANVETFIETDSPRDRPLMKMPEISDYVVRHKNVSVHELMDMLPELHVEGDEESGKGAEYGTRVHEAAYLMYRGIRYDNSLPEMVRIKSILNSLRGSKMDVEVKCVLPIENVSIRGIIDLIAEFDDHVEIHDYKTDETDRNLPLYKLQLSIYAHSASNLRKKVKCFIDYVSQGKTIEFDPISLEDIKSMVLDYNILKRRAYTGT
ncbi:MAG: UvrD-helicase domain-containing protein [Candidatus Methanomethylophilaceae archaeon]